MCPMYNEIPDFVQITDDIMIKALEPIQDRNVDLEITVKVNLLLIQNVMIICSFQEKWRQKPK